MRFIGVRRPGSRAGLTRPSPLPYPAIEPVRGCNTLKRKVSFEVGSREFARGLQILVVAGMALLSAGSALAQQQASSQPVLRLETGMHTAPIRAAASDAAGQMLATVSDDKTL